jgi:RNA polymerase sigma-54 factor
MPRLELKDLVSEQLAENPTLEELEEGEEGGETLVAEGAESETAEEAGEGGRDGTEPDGLDAASEQEGAYDSKERDSSTIGAESAGLSSQTETSQESSPETPAESPAESFDQIDLGEFFGEYMDGVSTAPRMQEEGEEFSLENRPETAPGLADHLTEQLGLSEATGLLREACAFLIGNIDPDGYFRLPLEEVETGVPCPLQCAEKALSLVQSFDPAGVGARSLSECLLIQAQAANVASPLLVELITNRLSDLGLKPLSALAKQLNVPVEAIQLSLEVIRHLDPKPGRRYDSSRTSYVEPDVTVIKVDDEYVVQFNDDGLPRLRLSRFWTEERIDTESGKIKIDLKGELERKEKVYLKERVRAAQWLMKSLEQRKKTIVRVAESIVKKQQDFFEYGVAHLRPLVLRDVAKDIDMHESTVSRVVSNKWMASPRGLLPMKFFFHSAVASTGGGEDVSSLAVKGKIRTLVEAEDPVHPVSDARLSELLERDGIRIARRTVAKYREELHIPSSSIRRCEPSPEHSPVELTTPPEGVEEGK